MSNGERGFTLAELLIVIAIIVILLIFVLVNIKTQIGKGNDAKRKSDVYNIRNAIENYVTDKNYAPPVGTINTCGSNALQPYLPAIPCDPTTQKPYGYFPSVTVGAYRVCAILQDTSDPAIAAENCGGSLGCGLGGGYNWCLASGVAPSAVGTADQGGTSGTGGPAPTATPTLGPGHLACAPPDINGISYCNYYDNPASFGCPVTFTDSATCIAACSNPANQCR